MIQNPSVSTRPFQLLSTVGQVGDLGGTAYYLGFPYIFYYMRCVSFQRILYSLLLNTYLPPYTAHFASFKQQALCLQVWQGPVQLLYLVLFLYAADIYLYYQQLKYYFRSADRIYISQQQIQLLSRSPSIISLFIMSSPATSTTSKEYLFSLPYQSSSNANLSYRTLISLRPGYSPVLSLLRILIVLAQFVSSTASLRTLYTLIRYIYLRILTDGSTLFTYSVASSSSCLTSIVMVLRMISPLIIRLTATIDAATKQALFLNIQTSYILVKPVKAFLISLLLNLSVIYFTFILLIIVGGQEEESGPTVPLARLGLGGVPPSTWAQLSVFLAYQGALTFTYRPRLSSLIACLSSSNSYIQSCIFRSST